MPHPNAYRPTRRLLSTASVSRRSTASATTVSRPQPAAHSRSRFPTRLCPERGLAAHLVIFFDADRPPGASGGQVGFASSACFEPGVIYLNGSFAGPQIVLNGGAVTVKATPLRGRLHAEH